MYTSIKPGRVWLDTEGKRIMTISEKNPDGV